MSLIRREPIPHAISHISDIKPIIDESGIWFPLAVHGAVVTYEKAVGVLADDTHASISEYGTTSDTAHALQQLSLIFGYNSIK